MSEWKVTASHRSRAAVIYVRQSTLVQVERNRESTARQYDLVSRARELGWPRSAVTVIDADLGVSGASAAGRSGFAQLATQVGMGQVGIVLSLECSRLARNNADWYRLLELAGMTDTLIADADGVYHPALFDDRLVLGMKGTMSEMELHILRARLDGGIRNKAARGELRRGLPVGLVWGEADGEILMHPDEAVTGVIAAIFGRFAVCGSVRGTWLWLRDQGLQFPLADSLARLDAAELTLRKATWLYDNGRPCGREANTAKYLCADAGFEAADRALQTHGGMGYAEEYHVARYFREARLLKIAPLSQEMVLNYLGSHVLGLPRSY